MLKRSLFLIATTFTSPLYADIPYCAGTQVEGSKHRALQKVVESFARENHCDIGPNSCLLNFETIKYAINWGKECPDSAMRDNDPRGSTFICNQGVCVPFGFYFPEAFYEEKLK